MKRVLSLVLTGILVFSILPGCSGQASAPTEEPTVNASDVDSEIISQTPTGEYVLVNVRQAFLDYGGVEGVILTFESDGSGTLDLGPKFHTVEPDTLSWQYDDVQNTGTITVLGNSLRLINQNIDPSNIAFELDGDCLIASLPSNITLTFAKTGSAEADALQEGLLADLLTK